MKLKFNSDIAVACFTYSLLITISMLVILVITKYLNSMNEGLFLVIIIFTLSTLFGLIVKPKDKNNEN